MHTEFFRSKKTPNEKSIYAPYEPFYYTVNWGFPRALQWNKSTMVDKSDNSEAILNHSPSLF